MGLNVGILSMQRIANYGSFLQAYGLKSILEELNCKVQFVDYHPGECLVESCEGKGIKRKFYKVMKVFCYHAPLREKIKFIQYKKNYSENYYPYLGITNEMNYTPEVDVLVIGSDEVFNCVQDNTNVGFSPELFGEGNRAKKVISYAASFGNTTLDKLNTYKIATKIGDWLNEFDSISVRDRNSGELIKSLTEKEPSYHLDPVLAYDFIGKCKQIPNSIPEKNYMLVYGYSGRFTKDECQEIRKYARMNNLKILCVGGVQDCCDKFIDCNPFEVIAYFMHAKCIITDTFHGTILSVITHRQFVSIVRNSGYGNSEKLLDLLERLNLKNRISDICSAKELTHKIQEDIEYDLVDAVIEKERQKTYHYLEGITQ